MSSGKSSSGKGVKNYYGSISGAISWGPIDWVRAIDHNCAYILQGPTMLTEDVTDFTGALVDPTYIARGGYLHILRGTETQPGYTWIPHAPRDKGTAKVVARHIFFGQGSGSAPNLQVIAGRLPRVPAEIVDPADNVAHEWQANPVAALAEFALDERGAGYPLEVFDAASWRAAAHWAYLNRARTFCSPLINEQMPFRDVVRRLLEPIGGFVRWTDGGQLACGIYEWGTTSGTEMLLDYRHWINRPKLPGADWASVPTEITVSFTNQACEYQKDAVTVPNAAALQIRQEDDQRTIDRRDVTRPAQAQIQGQEANRIASASNSKASITVRRPFAEALRIGDKIRIDTDPEPGGSGLAQLARVEKITLDASDSAVLEVHTDNLVPAVPYTPTPPGAAEPELVAPPIAHALAIPLPPAEFGWPLSVAVLATRPSRAVDGMRVFFAGEVGDDYAAIGTQYDFACRGQLASSIGAGTTTINVTELDGESGPDASLAANTPGGNLTAAQNNTHLIILAQVDGAGRVALDGNGDPVMEFVSVIDRSGTGATRSYSVLRGRLDTPARDWSAGAVAWILPRGHLTEWEPDYLRDFTGEIVRFRLVSFDGPTEDETLPVPEFTCQMIGAGATMYQRGLEGANSASVFIYQRAATAPALPDAATTYHFATAALVGLGGGWTQTIPAGTDPLWVSIAPAVATGPTDVIEPGEWADARVLAQNGTNGTPGTAGAPGANNATVHVYKRAASSPALPTTTATYTFATGVLTGHDNGWTQSIPAANGLPLYAAAATASSAGASDTITAGEWSSPVILAQDGAPGSNGSNGAPGTSNAVVFLYKRASSSPTVPSTTATYVFTTGVLSGHNNGWTQTVPSTDGNPCWVITATAASTGTSDTIATGEWAAPTKIVQDGAAGLNSASIFIYKRAASSPALPTVSTTYTFSTGVLSGLNNGWTQAIPSGDDPLYVSLATAASTGSTDTIAASEWASPSILAKNGEDGAPGGGASKVLTPVISFSPASYTSSATTTTCTIDCDTAGATIWVQVDGAAPRIYSYPFSLMRLKGVAAWAEKSDMTQSDTAWDMYEDNT